MQSVRGCYSPFSEIVKFTAPKLPTTMGTPKNIKISSKERQHCVFVELYQEPVPGVSLTGRELTLAARELLLIYILIRSLSMKTT